MSEPIPTWDSGGTRERTVTALERIADALEELVKVDRQNAETGKAVTTAMGSIMANKQSAEAASEFEQIRRKMSPAMFDGS